MSNDELYIKTYISKFESVLLDTLRKQVDSETKNSLYTSALQDLQKKLEESERYGNDTKAALDQALAGLQAVTLDKNELKAQQEKRETEFELIYNELEKTREDKQRELNDLREETQRELNTLREETQRELNDLREEKQRALNEVALLEQKVVDLKRLVETANVDADVLKNNYALVLKSLEEANAELDRVRLNKKSKKATAKESEWIDGDEIPG